MNMNKIVEDEAKHAVLIFFEGKVMKGDIIAYCLIYQNVHIAFLTKEKEI